MTFAEPPTEVAAFTDYGLQRGSAAGSLSQRREAAAAADSRWNRASQFVALRVRCTDCHGVGALTAGSPDVGRYDIDIGVPFWTHELKAGEVTPGVPIGSWSQQRGSAASSIQQWEHQTQSELQRLSQQIEMLRKTVEASLTAVAAFGQYAPTATPALHVDLAVVEEATARGVLAQLFDQIADEEAPCAPEIVEIAAESLASDNAKLRASAGRAY